MRKRRKYLWIPVLLLVLFTTGCNGDNHGESSAYEIFNINLGNGHTWVVDRDGATVSDGEDCYLLTDIATGEPQCLNYVTTEIEDSDDPYGAWRQYSALYDIDGNMLRDYEEVSYGSGFSQYVTSVVYSGQEYMNQYTTVLYDFVENEVVMEDIERAAPFHDNFILFDSSMAPLYLVDRDLRIIQDFKGEYTFGWCWKDYFIGMGEKENGEAYYNVLDGDLNVVVTKSYLNDSNAIGDRLFYRNDENIWGVMELSGEVVFTWGEDEFLQYFDGELGIIWEYPDDTLDIGYRLVDVQGDVLAEEYEGLDPCVYWTHYDEMKAEEFIGLKDGRIVILDRAGQVLYSREEDNIFSVYVEEAGLYSCHVGSEEGQSSFMLLDAELNTLAPAGKYYGISRGGRWINQKWEPYDFLICMRADDSLYDIIDLQGNLILSDLRQVYDHSRDRLAVAKGFQLGLMDFEGNWIVSRSIFDTLLD